MTTVLGYGAAVSGVLLALVTSGRSPLIPVVALPLAAALVIGVSAINRWTWPWQQSYVREVRRSEARLSEIVGRPLEPATAEAWLAVSTDAPASDRMVVLGWLGRYEAAEDLIPALPTTTPLDLYRRAYAEVFRGWRTTSTLDARPVVERLRDLEPSDRDRAESTIAFWRGVAEAGSGRELRDVPAPRGGRLSIRDEARLWLQRLWPLRWLLGMFLVTWVGLGVLTFVAAG